ncbi:MAG: prephenate dehydrogenase/arogenate dehydrogenase family protein [Puniceicoccales bacterium]|nr:prephenate dehydrogenase/arogenate dehydrogenase family protein [Puniceicoccales bacterium]
MFATIAILGTGLLGASLMQTVRKNGLARRVVAWSRRAETRARCAGQPWCDAVFDDPADCVRDAELVVVCAPVDKIGETLASAAAGISEGALVTDVGSTKAGVCRASAVALAGVGAAARFVGAHPLAGSEKSGPEHATAELFEGRVCFVTPVAETAAEAQAAVCRFWEAAGMRVSVCSPEEHDRLVARVSHLPHLAAAALSAALGRDPQAEVFAGVAGPGLRDTTRVSGGDPALWRAIAQENRAEIAQALAAFEAELGVFKRALETGDFDLLESELRRAREWREKL